MWPIKEKENKQLLIFVAKSYPLQLAVRMRRYGSLINIYPSATVQVGEEPFVYNFFAVVCFFTSKFSQIVVCWRLRKTSSIFKYFVARY